MYKTAIAIFFLVGCLPLAADAEQDTSTNAVKAEKKVVAGAEKPIQLVPEGETHPPSIWMQQKLKHSQKIFAGMVEGDMLAVETAAHNLKFINRLEKFARGRSKAYRTQLRVFQHANEQILEGVKNDNLDRVMLGYQQLTVSCVTCHNQLRKIK